MDTSKVGPQAALQDVAPRDGEPADEAQESQWARNVYELGKRSLQADQTTSNTLPIIKKSAAKMPDEPVVEPGLNLLCTPGNDVESTTAMAGAGANLLLFSTGLGTPTGNPVAPTLKLSTNTATAQRHDDFIDFDTGSIIRGEATIDELGEELVA